MTEFEAEVLGRLRALDQFMAVVISRAAVNDPLPQNFIGDVLIAADRSLTAINDGADAGDEGVKRHSIAAFNGIADCLAGFAMSLAPAQGKA